MSHVFIPIRVSENIAAGNINASSVLHRLQKSIPMVHLGSR